jgi:outer membrane protein assembly factor BamB
LLIALTITEAAFPARFSPFRKAQASGHGDAITQAYNANTGDIVWSARNNATPDRAESGWRVAIAGSRLVVAGSTAYSIDQTDPLNQTPAGNSSDYLIFAYDLP